MQQISSLPVGLRQRRPLALMACLMMMMIMLVICTNSGSLLLVAESHSLPSLSDELRSVGLDNFEGPMSEEQLQLVGKMSQLYEEDDRLHSREQALLNQVGRSRPDGAQKGALEVIFNGHLLNMHKLDKLKEQLKESLATIRNSAADSSPPEQEQEQ